MVDRQKTLIEFVQAWAEYEWRMKGIEMEAKKLGRQDPGLHQMISRITDDLMGSPDTQRQLAMRLALAEFSKSTL
jgi:hypothetical protein